MRRWHKVVLGAGILAGVAAGALAAHPAVLHCHSSNGLPDPVCTPGVVAETDPSVVCNRSTKTVRPPVAYTNLAKTHQLQQYDYVDKNPASYEEDHLIPLELGGSPIDLKNLWPEPWSGTESAKVKDRVENFLHKQVCGGKMTLKQAQDEISTNWEAIK